MRARRGTEGVVFYAYLYLFGRSGTGRDIAPGSLDVLATFGDRATKRSPGAAVRGRSYNAHGALGRDPSMNDAGRGS